MPRILEFKEIDGALWARIGRVEDLPEDESYVYIWTRQEAKDAEAAAIRTFCFSIANAYIEGRLNALPSPTPNR